MCGADVLLFSHVGIVFWHARSSAIIVVQDFTIGENGALAADEFDYIIVGAGSAGCVLANRLSADPAHRVLLIEAGGSDRRPWIRIPAGYGKSYSDPVVNWRYRTEPIDTLGGRRDYWPRGRVLGGSGSINALVYCRGFARDYQDWAAAGASGWGWADVLPWFRRVERFVDTDGREDGDGPLHIQRVDDQMHALNNDFADAIRQAGWQNGVDFNPPDGSPEGFGFYQITTRNGLRCSPADAYLHQIRNRRNLRIVTGAEAERIVMTDGAATGVVIRHQGNVETLGARRQVIVAAGAVNSPKLLQLSGIGPGGVLQQAGIPVQYENPAVGGGLQDHLAVSYYYRTDRRTLNHVFGTWRGRIGAAMQYALTRRGPLSLSVNQFGGFVRSSDRLSGPDTQLYMTPASYRSGDGYGQKPEFHPFDGFLISFQPCRPTSTGRIDIAGPDPAAPPLIRPEYLTTEKDVQDVLGGAGALRKVIATRAFGQIAKAPVDQDLTTMSDQQVVEDFRHRAGTIYHPVGTCGIGRVVDDRLRVIGVGRLRVVDASVFPMVTSANTNAPTLMTGEKGADMILRDTGGVPTGG